MAFHVQSHRTEARSSRHKLCKSLTRPSVSPLNYRHPSICRQTDRQTEIVNKEIGKFLQIYCFEKQDSWFTWLPITQFSINTKKHTSTKKSPFDMTRSYLPCMGIEPISSDKAPAAQKFAAEMEDVIESVKENMKQAQD